MRDSVIFAVVRTSPREIPLAMITMRKSIHGFSLLSYIGIGLLLAALRAAGAPLQETINAEDVSLAVIAIHYPEIRQATITPKLSLVLLIWDKTTKRI